MKALILVGGYGTRLRPLTLSVPKPLIHFCNHPIIEYQIRALKELNVTHVILAVAYRPDALREALQRLEQKYQIKLSCSVEEEPLLTAGPIRLARDLLMDDEEGEEYPDLFFVFNSDIICEFPLAEMLQMHLKHGAEGTICVTHTEEPSLYGVVQHDPQTGLINRFIEKPKAFVGDCINAGLYLFRRAMIDRIDARPTSIETEIFPQMAAAGELYCYRINGYWADIGKPGDFLIGSRLYLNALSSRVATELGNINNTDGASSSSSRLTELAEGDNIQGNVLIDPSAEIGDGCIIGPDVCIGRNCKVGRGVRIANSSLMENVVVGDYSWIDSSILGWNSKIGKWVRIEGLTVLGQDVAIKDEVFMNGAFVLPYRGISNSVPTPGTIIM